MLFNWGKFQIHLRRILVVADSIRTIQKLLGHKDLKIAMIYTHVLNQGPKGVRSPADIL
jgi:site-specific recombinase XerD